MRNEFAVSYKQKCQLIQVSLIIDPARFIVPHAVISTLSWGIFRNKTKHDFSVIVIILEVFFLHKVLFFEIGIERD